MVLPPHPAGKLREVLHKEKGPDGCHNGVPGPRGTVSGLFRTCEGRALGCFGGVNTRGGPAWKRPHRASSQGVNNVRRYTLVPLRRHDLGHVGGGV
ncbi:hypothetical protein GCM10014713_30890 [Streptomyces purpureus]|uniref:Uncharacterized protein n=1 Tax=Streptomyces purpureus TaxID=1951 RepID=A0A918H390_9ACTN|nr:hypothetical protein GCM10014713_30890 [Streptomyces purpureus]